MQSEQSVFPQAPNLHQRRRAWHFRTWGLFLGFLIMAIYSNYIGVSNELVMGWLISIVLLLLVEEITTPYSALLRGTNWLKNRIGSDHQSKVEEPFFWLTPEPQLSGHGLFQLRNRYRWLLLTFLVVFTWLFIFLQSFVETIPSEAKIFRLSLVIVLIGFNLIPYAVLIGEIFKRSGIDRPLGRFTWILIIPTVLFFTFALILNTLMTSIWPVVYLSGVLSLLHIFAYVSQRLWMGERAHSEVIRNLSLILLTTDDPVQSLENDVPRYIGKSMRYDHVSVLVASRDQKWLQVVGQYSIGNYHTHRGKEISASVGITGRTFSSRKSHYYNDVRKSAFYLSLAKKDEVDHTKAEIDVPIEYKDKVYGVLNVQAKRSEVFSEKDLQSLEVIAKLLGAVIAANQSNLLLQDALRSWKDIASEKPASEMAVFEHLAQFTIESLGANVAIYQPLSGTGFIVCPAYICERLNESITEPKKQRIFQPPYDYIFSLIKKWEPQYDDNGNVGNSKLATLGSSQLSSIIMPGMDKSICFIPVGTPKERLGFVLLYFEEVRNFDSLFRLTLLSLIQAFTTILSLVRYREIFFKGFGRPELSLHNIMGRYGLKNGVLRGAIQDFKICEWNKEKKIEKCGLFPRLSQVDGFLKEISLAESSIPPDFWRRTLKSELEDLELTLPKGTDGRPPVLDFQELDHRIENESPWVKLAIYRIIVEAIDNGLRHGQATVFKIKGHRDLNSLSLEILNNGNKIDDDAEKKRTKSGIFSQLEKLEEEFGAYKDHGNTINGEVFVKVSIPCLPLNI